MSDLLIGADPEFFVKKDGKFVSAYGLIEGTKKNPQKVEGGAVQVDGMALEININPATTFKEFEYNFTAVMHNLRKMVPDEYEFAFVPVADFDPDYIKSQPEEARALGCDPDFNAYTGEANNPPDAAKNFRTASGHFHLGWTEDEDIKNPEHIEACQMMTKQLDAGIGLKGVVFDPDPRRRELYGKAGAYRPKPYGVEYRVLSNFWLNNLSWRKELFNDIKFSYDMLIDGTDYDKFLTPKFAATIINDNNVHLAYEYIWHTTGRTNNIEDTYTHWLSTSHPQAKGAEKAQIAKKRRNLEVKRIAFDDLPRLAAAPRRARNPAIKFVGLNNVVPPAQPAQPFPWQAMVLDDDLDILLNEIGAQHA